MTYLAYLEDTYKNKDSARLLETGEDELGPFVLLDRTIFHPQGGGQPADQGMIKMEDIDIPIHMVKKVGSEIRHYTNQDYTAYKGQEGVCLIDEARRLLYARLHSAGHLLNNVVGQLYPAWVGIKGHHFPKEAYVEFKASDDSAPVVEGEAISRAMQEAIDSNAPLILSVIQASDLDKECPDLPYKLAVSDPTVRIIRIGDFSAVPCGGTHVKSCGELAGFQVTKCKIKGDTLKVSYDIGATQA